MQKPDDAQLDAIFSNLDEREMMEYNDVCRQMSNAQSRAEIVAIYQRCVQATFAPLLLNYGNKVIKEKGW